MITRVVDIAIALGVLVSGSLLWRMTRESRALRYVGILIAAVVLLATVWFVSAAWTGTPPRPNVLDLPVALKYAGEVGFFAALVVLPLGWVISVVRLGIPRLRSGAPGTAAIRCAALTACTGLLVAQFGQPQSTIDARSPEQRIATLQSSLRAIADGDRDLPRDRWDPEYVINVVGRDPRALFRWVQQNTYWIPYRGLLRGPVGVLNDRQGNSLDRAMLLSTLLEKAGFVVRIAHGEITHEDASAMLPNLVAERVVDFAEPPAKAEPLPGIREAAVQYQLDADSIQRTLADQEQRADRVAKELDARVEQQTKYLLQSIQRPEKDADWRDRVEKDIAALQDHWWVQLQDSSRWVDLDLFVGDATSSVSLTVPKETFAPSELASDLYHQIVMRVVAEQWSAGKTQERTAIEYTLRPANVIGQPIVLQFAPTDWLSDSGSVAQTPSDIRAGALKIDEWAAGLVVGGKEVASAFLRDTGDEKETPKGGLFGFGAALDSTMNQRRHPKSPTHLLSAVWIEYEIRVPGEKPRTIRRTIFDLIGPAARSPGVPQFELDESKKVERSLALGMKTEILPQVCQFAPEYVAHLTSAPIAANQNLLAAALKPDFSPDSDEGKRMLQQAVPPASPLIGLAYTRMEWNHAHSDVFINQPNILSRHRYLAARPTGIVYADVIDIVNNDVGVSLAASDTFAARLQQGVRDTNNEALLFGGGGIGNVGDAYAESHNWTTITSATRSTLDQLKLPADTRRRIAQDIESESLVVTPDSALHRHDEEFVGWWRIDATTGTSLGVGANGWGQDAAEESLSERAAAAWFEAFFWENGLCHVYGQAINATLVFKEILVGDWHPSWTGSGPKSKHPAEVVRENARMCLIQGMVAGYLATLPLLLIALMNTRLMRRLRQALKMAETEEELAMKRSPPRQPCEGTALLIRQPLPEPGLLASFSITPVMALFFSGTLPCVHPHGEGPPKSEPAPPKSPQKKDPCEVSSSGAKETPSNGPDPIADLAATKQQLEAAYNSAAAEESHLHKDFIQALQELIEEKQHMPSISFKYGGAGDPSKFDKAAYDQALAKFRDAEKAYYSSQARAEEARRAVADFSKAHPELKNSQSPSAAPSSCEGSNQNVGDGSNSGDPSTGSSGQSGGNTKPGLGDPTSDTNGPPTIRDPQPGDEHGPPTQPDPYTDPARAKTVPMTPAEHVIQVNPSNGQNPTVPVKQVPAGSIPPAIPGVVGAGGTLDAFGFPNFGVPK